MGEASRREEPKGEATRRGRASKRKRRADGRGEQKG
jgi:hypothetical protein